MRAGSANGGKRGLRRRPTVEGLEERVLLSRAIEHGAGSIAAMAMVRGVRPTRWDGAFAGPGKYGDIAVVTHAGRPWRFWTPGRRPAHAGLAHPRPPFVRGPLVQVSSPAPLADPSVDNVAAQTGTVFLGSAVEPQLAVNPRFPQLLVGVWQKDRWSNGGARGIVAGISHDGGRTWRRMAVPGLTLATGGPYQRASDPWVDFAAQGRGAYISGLPFNEAIQDQPSGQSAVSFNQVFHGARTFTSPAFLDQLTTSQVQTDKEMITADPIRPHFAYAAWERLQVPPTLIPFGGPALFTRTTNGGQSWEDPRVIYDPGPNAVTINHQVFARPDGTLLDTFTEFRLTALSPEPQFQSTLSVLRSPDRGVTWGKTPLHGFDLMGSPVIDPDTNTPIRTPSTPSGVPAQWADVEMNPQTGTLYAVWQDARFSAGSPYPIDGIAFARSTDGGATWSKPIQINQPPADLPLLDRQAFLPAIQVASDGTLGVSYYDFRYNTATDPGTQTDAWILFCHAGADCTDPLNWGDEVRLTDTSFNLRHAPLTTGGLTGGGYFLGDYTGLETVGRQFLALFPITFENGPAAVVFRRVGPAH